MDTYTLICESSKTRLSQLVQDQVAVRRAELVHQGEAVDEDENLRFVIETITGSLGELAEELVGDSDFISDLGLTIVGN